eukprot:Pompholyxophrys_punicea_v1_NODE_348_length_2194_cov_18.530154.p2 type:complete len:192 gc:universal NODE_348_length_2194_cov_18.530154:1561-2136(+)
MFIVVNRKGDSSINVLAVCDANEIFTFAHVGEPGSVHDSRVFYRSGLLRMMQNPHYFYGETAYVLGDSAYALLPWLMTPYPRTAGMTEAEARYNQIHSSMRMCVERAFGKLKGRWRILKTGVESPSIAWIDKTIYACMILHNICQRGDDVWDQEEDEEVNDLEEHIEEPGHVTNAMKELARNIRNAEADNL